MERLEEHIADVVIALEQRVRRLDHIIDRLEREAANRRLLESDPDLEQCFFRQADHWDARAVRLK